MPDNVLAVAGTSLQKTKPRYTETENEVLFESWWNPQKRRELVNRLGRKMSALRSQFCRLLKEKGMSNQDYYNLMQSKYANGSGVTPRKRSRELKDIDRTILEVFCKHQALGNSRADACAELQEKLGSPFTPAALKLRFYRLIKRLNYTDEDLLAIGQRYLDVVNENVEVDETKQDETIAIPQLPLEKTPLKTKNPEDANSFLYQLSSLPETLNNLEARVNKIETSQRHQLDLRGFVEHLLAVERDLKREDKLMEEIQRLMDENEQLQKTVEKERERLKKREEELADVYKMLNTMLNDFMHLESVSKLASLGDFMHRLEITVDQFGNVLKSKRVGS
jgi:septum formation topological specificity factor MinE